MSIFIRFVFYRSTGRNFAPVVFQLLFLELRDYNYLFFKESFHREPVVGASRDDGFADG